MSVNVTDPDGVPVPDDLMEQLRAVARTAGVPFVLMP